MTRASDNQFPKVTLLESAAPSTPASTLGFLYEKTDGKLYFKNDAGTETDLTGSAGGLTFTGEARTELVNASSAVSVGATTVASGAPDGSTAVQLELWIVVQSGTPDAGNLIQVSHGVTGNAAAIVRSPSAVGYFNHIQCTVALDASEQFQYSLTRVNGTIGYRIYRVGYWKPV